MSEPAPQPAAPPQAQPRVDGPTLTTPPLPAQKERVPYESSSRSRGWFGTRHASHSKTTSRSTQTARRSAPAAKTAAQDDSLKQLMADLEKTKREKAALESKLSDESAKQTQQRLELEARLALLQEQMRQQSSLQQVMFQQQAPAMVRPSNSYYGPVITSGAPSPSLQMPFSANASVPSYASQPQPPAVPAWGNSAPAWNNAAVPPTQQVEQWPYSPQRR